MAEEIIKYGAGGVPYVGSIGTTTPLKTEKSEEEVITEEEPAVKVSVIEKETPGEISTGKRGRKQK